MGLRKQEEEQKTEDDRAGTVSRRGEEDHHEQRVTGCDKHQEERSTVSMGRQNESKQDRQPLLEGDWGNQRGGAPCGDQEVQLGYGPGEGDWVNWWRGWAVQNGEGQETVDSEEQREWAERERAHFLRQQRACEEEDRLREDEIALQREENKRRRARMEKEEELRRQVQAQKQHQGSAARSDRFSGFKRGVESWGGEEGGDKRQRVEEEGVPGPRHAERTVATAKGTTAEQEAVAPKEYVRSEKTKKTEAARLKRTFGEATLAVYQEAQQPDLPFQQIWRRTCRKVSGHDSLFNVRKKTSFNGVLGFMRHLLKSGWFQGTEPPLPLVGNNYKPKTMIGVSIETIIQDLEHSSDL